MSVALGKSQISREEEADQALKQTRLPLGVAWTLCLAFLLTITSVPAIQYLVELRRHRVEDRFALLPSLQEIGSVRDLRDALRLLPQEEEIRQYESALEDQSVVSAWLLPYTQHLLTGLLGAGNEQAYRGRDGWLVYRPDVDYLTSGGFLEGSVPFAAPGTGHRAPGTAVEAIIDFQRQLAAREIALIVVPAPVKPMIHPEKLSRRYTPADGPLQNPSYSGFRQSLQAAGVLLFDPSPALAEAKRQSGRPQYLETDTHWTPAAMERCAAALARFIQAHVRLPQRAPVAYTRGAAEVANLGDVATMLRLPEGQRLFPRQRVRLRPVRAPSGEPWRPQSDADILLLGDSFSNIYSLKGMGWGEAAGFAEQLSAELRRPLDTITINAGGSFATRQRLRQEIARGRDRLAGKRLVIWQFAMRDLLVGEWKRIPLGLRSRKRGTAAKRWSGEERESGNAMNHKATIDTKKSRGVVLLLLLMIAAIGPGCARQESATRDETPGDTGRPSRANEASSEAGSDLQDKPAPEGSLVVQGEVLVASKVPEPGQAPYSECLTAVKYKVLSVERGEYSKPELLALHWGMKENRLTPAARYQAGERHRLELEPLSRRPELERVMQADDTGAFELTPYFVVKAEPGR